MSAALRGGYEEISVSVFCGKIDENKKHKKNHQPKRSYKNYILDLCRIIVTKRLTIQ